jgi:hypothetical protein
MYGRFILATSLRLLRKDAKAMQCNARRGEVRPCFRVERPLSSYMHGPVRAVHGMPRTGGWGSLSRVKV